MHTIGVDLHKRESQLCIITTERDPHHESPQPSNGRPSSCWRPSIIAAADGGSALKIGPLARRLPSIDGQLKRC